MSLLQQLVSDAEAMEAEAAGLSGLGRFGSFFLWRFGLESLVVSSYWGMVVL